MPKRTLLSANVASIVNCVCSFQVPAKTLVQIFESFGKAENLVQNDYCTEDDGTCLAVRATCIATGQSPSYFRQFQDVVDYSTSTVKIDDLMCDVLGIDEDVLTELKESWDDCDARERKELARYFREAHQECMRAQEITDVLEFEQPELQRGVDDQRAEQVAYLRTSDRFRHLVAASVPETSPLYAEL